jgi:hypothetical protein
MNKNPSDPSVTARPSLSTITTLFITLLIAAGCSKSDNPAAKGKGASGPQPVAEEAIKQATKFAAIRWEIQEQRAVWFGHVPGETFVGTNCDAQFKPVTAYLAATDLSEADRLNGVQWVGDVQFYAPAFRVRLADKSWSDWQKCNPTETSPRGRLIWTESLKKSNGTWGPGLGNANFWEVSKPVSQ